MENAGKVEEEQVVGGVKLRKYEGQAHPLACPNRNWKGSEPPMGTPVGAAASQVTWIIDVCVLATPVISPRGVANTGFAYEEPG